MLVFCKNFVKYHFSSNLPRNKNFFEINPIFPTNQSDYKLHGFRKQKIGVLETGVKSLIRTYNRNSWISQSLKKKQLARLKNKPAQKILQDAETHLPFGYGFDWYISLFKSKKTQKINVAYIDTIQQIINKFKLKSQPQLVRFFRLGIANLQKDQFRQKIKGQILKNCVLEAMKSKYKKSVLKNPQQILNNGNSVKPLFDQQFLDNQAFLKALQNIDKKIQISESKLEIHSRYSLRQDLYDINYKLPNQITIQQPKNADILHDQRLTVIKGYDTNGLHPSKFQDHIIEQKIRKLYFLKKVEQKPIKNHNNKKNADVLKDIDLIGFDHIIQKLAYQYKIDQVPETNIVNIYKQIDLLVDNLKITNKTEAQPIINLDSILSKLRDPKQLLWKNLNLDKVCKLDSHQTFQEQNNQIKDEQKYNLTASQKHQNSQLRLSPNYDLETSLNQVPFNLHKHSQLQALGIFTDVSHYKDFDITKLNLEPAQTKFNHFRFVQRKQRKRRAAPAQNTKLQFHGSGKRKSCLAICRVRYGTGIVTVNKVNIRDYFVDPYFRAQALKPLIYTGKAGNVDIDFHVSGSGTHSQTTACSLALARALFSWVPQYKKIFRKVGLVTVDPRFKQRKRIGKYKARKGYVYVRR